LNHLTEQLLSLTTLDNAGILHLQTMDLWAFMEEIKQKAVHLVGSRTFTVIHGPDIHLFADPDLLTQVLFNLIDNAVQHSSPTGMIEMGWRTDKDVVMLSVADDGEGIGSEDLPHIFDAFYRGDRSRSRRQGGTGLGLAIVHAIVQAHQGTIAVSSRPGTGTEFLVRLPLHRPAPGS